MSRNQPTIEERATGKALLKSIDDGSHKITNFEFGDRPDLTLRVDGHCQGYEIASLLPGEIHHNMKNFAAWLYRAKGVIASKIIIPIEPHMWIKEIVEKKWERAQKFPQTEFTQDLSLLIHPPRLMGDFVDYDDAGFMGALELGLACSDHGFAGVGFYSGKRFVRLRTLPKADHTKLVWPDLTEGYPAGMSMIYSGKESEVKKYLQGKKISHDDIPEEYTKRLKPMSPQFEGLEPKLPKNYKLSMDFGDLPKPG